MTQPSSPAIREALGRIPVHQLGDAIELMDAVRRYCERDSARRPRRRRRMAVSRAAR